MLCTDAESTTAVSSPIICCWDDDVLSGNDIKIDHTCVNNLPLLLPLSLPLTLCTFKFSRNLHPVLSFFMLVTLAATHIYRDVCVTVRFSKQKHVFYCEAELGWSWKSYSRSFLQLETGDCHLLSIYFCRRSTPAVILFPTPQLCWLSLNSV